MAKPKGDINFGGRKGGKKKPSKKDPKKDEKVDDGSDLYTGGDYISPPFLSFDPALAAEQRAIERGLEDYNFDFKRQRRLDQRDYRQRKRDLKQEGRRGKQDIRTDKRRGLRDLRYERTDIQRDARRGQEDYGQRLGELFRGYGIKGTQQAQAANSAGVADGGTLAAAAQARKTNFMLDKKPLDTALQRQTEDTATSLKRLSGEKADFLQDTSRAKNRLGQDLRREKKLSKRSFRDTRRTAFIERQRAIREAEFGTQDLTAQQIFQARQLKPGAFDKYGKRVKKGKK